MIAREHESTAIKEYDNMRAQWLESWISQLSMTIREYETIVSREYDCMKAQ